MLTEEYLANLDRKKVQFLAKKYGIKANGKTKDMISALLEVRREDEDDEDECHRPPTPVMIRSPKIKLENIKCQEMEEVGDEECASRPPTPKRIRTPKKKVEAIEETPLIEFTALPTPQRPERRQSLGLGEIWDNTEPSQDVKDMVDQVLERTPPPKGTGGGDVEKPVITQEEDVVEIPMPIALLMDDEVLTQSTVATDRELCSDEGETTNNTDDDTAEDEEQREEVSMVMGSDDEVIRALMDNTEHDEDKGGSDAMDVDVNHVDVKLEVGRAVEETKTERIPSPKAPVPACARSPAPIAPKYLLKANCSEVRSPVRSPFAARPRTTVSSVSRTSMSSVHSRASMASTKRSVPGRRVSAPVVHKSSATKQVAKRSAPSMVPRMTKAQQLRAESIEKRKRVMTDALVKSEVQAANILQQRKMSFSNNASMAPTELSRNRPMTQQRRASTTNMKSSSSPVPFKARPVPNFARMHGRAGSAKENRISSRSPVKPPSVFRSPLHVNTKARK